MLIPFRWNLRGKLPQIEAADFFNARECRFKPWPAGNIVVDLPMVESSVIRHIREGPSASIEAVVLVNEYGSVFTLTMPHKYGLAVITIRNPFVERQSARKIFAIRQLTQRFLRQRAKSVLQVAQSKLATARTTG